jgi:hypothetical protein
MHQFERALDVGRGRVILKASAEVEGVGPEDSSISSGTLSLVLATADVSAVDDAEGVATSSTIFFN